MDTKPPADVLAETLADCGFGPPFISRSPWYLQSNYFSCLSSDSPIAAVASCSSQVSMSCSPS